MIREVYYLLNIFLILLFAVFACALQSVFLKLNFISWLHLDILLLIVVYLALHRNLIEGGMITVIIARLVEVNSGSPAGLMISCYLIVFLTTLFSREMFLLGTSVSTIILAMLGGLIWKLSLFLITAFLGILPDVWRSLLIFLIPSLIALGIFITPVFSILEKIDRLRVIEGL